MPSIQRPLGSPEVPGSLPIIGEQLIFIPRTPASSHCQGSCISGALHSSDLPSGSLPLSLPSLLVSSQPSETLGHPCRLFSFPSHLLCFRDHQGRTTLASVRLQDGHPTPLTRVCSKGTPQLPEPGLVLPPAGELQMRVICPFLPWPPSLLAALTTGPTLQTALAGHCLASQTEREGFLLGKQTNRFPEPPGLGIVCPLGCDYQLRARGQLTPGIRYMRGHTMSGMVESTRDFVTDCMVFREDLSGTMVCSLQEPSSCPLNKAELSAG